MGMVCTRSGTILGNVVELSGEGSSSVRDSRKKKGKKRKMDSLVAERQCVICLTDYNVEEEMYSLNCSENHYFCLTCLVRLISIAVKGSEDTAPYIPACPFANRPIANGGCEYAIPQAECEQILTLAMNSPKVDVISYEEGEELLKKCRETYLQNYRQKNCIRCPSCPPTGDGYWIPVPSKGKRARMKKKGSKAECPSCQSSFCSLCLKSPYHYGCRCNEVMPYTKVWLEWLATGRQLYLQELAKHEEIYHRSLQEYSEKQQEHEKRCKELEDRLREFQEGEKTLVKMFKACPHCLRCVERISGCDSVICGNGSPGVGCGKPFNWSKANAYCAEEIEKKLPAPMDIVAPQKAYEIRHEIRKGVPLQCDCCKSNIVGPKIQCLNCYSHTLCIACSGRTPSNGTLVSGHRNGHICKITFK